MSKYLLVELPYDRLISRIPVAWVITHEYRRMLSEFYSLSREAQLQALFRFIKTLKIHSYQLYECAFLSVTPRLAPDALSGMRIFFGPFLLADTSE